MYSVCLSNDTRLYTIILILFYVVLVIHDEQRFLIPVIQEPFSGHQATQTNQRHSLSNCLGIFQCLIRVERHRVYTTVPVRVSPLALHH